jgi:hypothetical protein
VTKRWKKGLSLGLSLLLSPYARASGGLELTGGSLQVTGPASLQIAKDVSLSTGTLQAFGNAQFQVGGNWSLGATGDFIADRSTVLFTGNCTLSGTNSFYNLTAATPGQTLTLPAGLTQTISNAFAMNGSPGLLSRLCSSVPGTYANLASLGSSSVGYVDVRDNDAFAGQVIAAGAPSQLTHTINWYYAGAFAVPHAVTQVQAATHGTGASTTLTYSWAPVTTYSDGTPIPSGIGTTYEITQYADLTQPSNGTIVASGLVSSSYGPVAAAPAGSVVYYGLQAVVDNVPSDSFYVDNNLAPNFIYPAASGGGYVSLPPALQVAFNGTTTPYNTLGLILHPEALGGGVLAAAMLQVQSTALGNQVSDDHFTPPGASMVLTLTPNDIGQNVWPVQLQVNGGWATVATAQRVGPSAASFTLYQDGFYRIGPSASAAVAAGTVASALPILQSVHPRLFSPNGDGYNDIVHFDLNNPGQQPVHGEIFDLRAARVVTMSPSALGLQWDGRDATGRTVPGGVYLYQIFVGSQRVNGTIVVVK